MCPSHKRPLFGVLVLVGFAIAGWLLYPENPTIQPQVASTLPTALADNISPSPSPSRPEPTIERAETTKIKPVERTAPQPRQKQQSEKDRSPINQTMKSSPGGVQQIMKDSPGGIQVGGDLNINNIPEPKFALQPVRENESFGDQYKTIFRLIIDSKVPVPNLILEAECPSIVDINVASLSGGIGFLGRSAKRDGYAYTTLPHAYGGTYLISVVTKERDKCKVSYRR